MKTGFVFIPRILILQSINPLTSPAPDKQRIARRPASQVMRLERLGSFHQSRLSFMRVLTRRLKKENWTFSCVQFDVSDNGVGHAVYSAIGPIRTYSLVAFAHDLPADKRSDRVIAEAWDATFVLFDGVPDANDIQRLSENVPYQEAGRVSATELTLSRANRSVRLWEHVVDALSQGVQPDQSQIDSIGYLMRTTAVYGSGKFGAADRESIAERDECKAPFQMEMLSVYLIRTFVRDLVQHMAKVRGGESAVALDKNVARRLGIGNSTGLGMAPFIINHPQLFNNWIAAKEEALAQVRSVVSPTQHEISQFESVLQSAVLSAQQWHSEHDLQKPRILQLRSDLQTISEKVQQDFPNESQPWNVLYEWACQSVSLEAQECLVSLMLEPYGHLIDGFECCMGSDSASIVPVNGAMTLAELQTLLRSHYEWALPIEWDVPSTNARAWYVSEEKLEPRLGERFEEPIAEYEQPLSPARDAMRLLDTIRQWPAEANVAELLLKHPEHRHSVRRTQTIAKLPYGEIRDNTIDQQLLPIDMLRSKLSFFGAIHFDPRSDRWVRIRMFGNAPYPEELQHSDADFWVYPDYACGSNQVN